MPVKKYLSDIVSIIHGTTPITKVYHGTTQVYPELTKVWVYQGTSGTYDIDHTTATVSLCKLATTTYTKNSLEAAYPAANYDVGHQARVNTYDTATPLPNWCGFDFFEVEYE